MHILILSMHYPEKDSFPYRGYMFFEQAMQLAKSGCKVGLAFMEQRPLKNFTWKRFRKESHLQISAEDNGSFITMRLHAWNPELSTRAGGIIWSLLTVLLVRKYIRTYGHPDLIHARFGAWAGYAARLVYKWYKVPHAITEHASSIDGNQTTPSQAVILKKAYSKARKIICVGTKLKRSLCVYVSDPGKMTVIPNLVNTNTFAFSPHQTEKKKHFTFISVGNLNKRKGFWDLLTVLHWAFKDMPHVSSIIAGDGEGMQPLKGLIQSLHLQEQVKLTDRLSREELSGLLGTCDASVLASFTETFDIVFIEAIATGLPAIDTICGGPEDIVTSEGGFLIQPGDVDALAAKMKTLYDIYESFGKEKIRQSTVNRFDFQLAGQKLRQVYPEALEMSKPPRASESRKLQS